MIGEIKEGKNLNITSKILISSILLLAVVIAGFIASQGQLIYLLAIPVIIAGMIIAFNSELLLLVTLFGGLVISGILQLYVPQLQLLRWAFSVSATFLIVHVVINAYKNDSLSFKIDSSILFWALCFIAVLSIVSVFQNHSLSTAIVGIKGYLQVWGILFALALLPWKTSHVNKYPLIILLVALLQIPFVLHQFFILVPMRTLITNVAGLVPIDIVSGTFGGKIDQGGANAALTVLCFIAGAGITALWKHKLIAFHVFAILITLVMFPAFINSTKVSVIYLFVVLIVIFIDELIFDPFKFISKLLAVIGLCFILALSVIKTMPESSNVSSLSDLYEHTYGYNVESDNIRDNNLSRTGTIKAWLNPIKAHDLSNQILGYGIGSSRLIDSSSGQNISSVINLERATGVTAIAAIIWETGILGVLTIIMLFISAFFVTMKLKRIYLSPYHQSIFSSMQCAVIILFISLGHHNFFILHIGFQTMFVAIFGYIAFWERQANRELHQNIDYKINYMSKIFNYDYDDFD